MRKKNCHCFVDLALSIVEINQTVLFTKSIKLIPLKELNKIKLLTALHVTLINPFTTDSSQCKKKSQNSKSLSVKYKEMHNTSQGFSKQGFIWMVTPMDYIHRVKS